MKVNIIIPTYDRAEKLERAIKSIIGGDHRDVEIFVIIDGNSGYRMDSVNSFVTVFRNEERKDWVYSMNRVLREMGDMDAAIYASDDLQFPSYALSKATAVLREQFPDGDGVISLKQSCAGVDSAFGLMGGKFIERFPNRQVFCPDYIHYVSDVELGKFAKSINRFYFCGDVVLQHERANDKTRELGLKVLDIDRATEIERVRRGFLWGRTFERVKG